MAICALNRECFWLSGTASIFCKGVWLSRQEKKIEINIHKDSVSMLNRQVLSSRLRRRTHEGVAPFKHACRWLRKSRTLQFYVEIRFGEELKTFKVKKWMLNVKSANRNVKGNWFPLECDELKADVWEFGNERNRLFWHWSCWRVCLERRCGHSKKRGL